MVSPNIQKWFVTGVVVFFVAIVGYKLFTTPAVTIGNVDIAVSNTEIVGQDILTLVDKLRMIAIDQLLFSSDLFNNLRDYSSQITPESQGRTNPFALIGSDSTFSTAGGNRTATSSRP